MRTPSTSSDPPDQPARERIVQERARNVVVIAGAGTGKTRTIIDRAVELLAPAAADVAPLSIQRMAAITFTRRAAGELRFRLRERLLRELETAARRAPHRTEPLRAALGNLDAAFVGTIHGFADRLLRLRPVEADLSPSFTLIDDTHDLVRETLARLRRGVELGSLAADLGRFAATLPAGLIDEAGATLRAAVESGLPLERTLSTWGALPSLEETLQHMIDSRDVDLELPPIPDPALADATAAAHQFGGMVDRCRGGSAGVARLRRIARALLPLAHMQSPAAAIRLVTDAMRGRPLFKGRDFNDDNVAWGLYKTIHPEKPRDAWILARLKGPHRWLATRLVRLAPVACAMYAQVKAEHEVVDYLDLLIQLRRLLRDDVEARHFYQGLFDHLFVDEFQDTDPLQCEIVFYLCGAGRSATRSGWDEIDLASGKLTIVGDPKQSIYRFRRADIAMYSRAVERLVAQGARRERLETNFRSTAPLIEFYNTQLARLLGRDAASFDPSTGRAAYEDLRAAVPAASSDRAVHVMPYAGPGSTPLLAQPGRAVEAAALARYVRATLDAGLPVRDLDTGAARPVLPGDIAILACVTTQLPLLLREFDALDIPYTARGGTLFLGDPTVRRFLLALRAIADRHDGVAEAALLQPPFFALDWDDHVAGQIFKKPDQDERRARLEAAREIVAELRRRRAFQSPGATARDVIEKTALGRVVATSRNGAQSLAALYEVALEADRLAALDGLDFDAVTEVFRTWAVQPTYLEMPEPIGTGAVRVLSVHGAKGLEFPIVALWDGFQILTERRSGPWQIDRDGRSWALSLGSVSVEFPHDGLVGRERSFGVEERKRMYYVAATRARDRLVIPVPVAKGRWEYATAALVADVDPAQVEILATYLPDNRPPWARVAAPAYADKGPDPEQDALLDRRGSELAARLDAAIAATVAPTSVTALAGDALGSAQAEDGDDAIRRDKVEGSRHGTAFGLTVHRALELLLSGAELSGPVALDVAATEHGIREQRAEAQADVDRALATLECEGLRATGELAVEYPIVGVVAGRLVSGFIDALHVTPQRVTVIDFKTDAPRAGALGRVYKRYARQLELYAELLRLAGVVGTAELRLGILFTATGELRWHPTSTGAT